VVLKAVVFDGAGTLWKLTGFVYDGEKVAMFQEETLADFTKMDKVALVNVEEDLHVVYYRGFDGKEEVLKKLIKASLSLEDVSPILDKYLRGEDVCTSIVLNGEKTICWLRLRASLYPEAKDAVKELRNLGIDIFIASGNCEKLCLKLAQDLSVPAMFVKPNASPEGKQDFVKLLDGFYGVVFMVGDNENDALAFEAADVSILVDRTSKRRARKDLIENVDYVVNNLREVVDIVKEF